MPVTSKEFVLLARCYSPQLGQSDAGARATYGAHEERDGDGLLGARHDVGAYKIGYWYQMGIDGPLEKGKRKAAVKRSDAKNELGVGALWWRRRNFEDTISCLLLSVQLLGELTHGWTGAG